MTQKEFNEVVISQTERCKSLLTAKGSEYAPKAARGNNADRLAHFKKAAVVMNSTPNLLLKTGKSVERGLLVPLGDKENLFAEILLDFKW